MAKKTKKVTKKKASGRSKTVTKKKTAKKKTKKAATKKKTKITAKKATKKKSAVNKTSRTKKVMTKKSSKKTTRRRKKAGKYLTQKEIQHFRTLLIEKWAEIVGDVNMMENEALRKSRLDAAGDLSSMPIHMADIGTDNFEQEFALGLMDSERKILVEIRDALKRMDEGSYGFCEGTGNPIGKPRLEASPWARYCIEYASMLEKGLVSINDDRDDEYEDYDDEFDDEDENFEDDDEDLDDTDDEDDTDNDDDDEADLYNDPDEDDEDDEEDKL